MVFCDLNVVLLGEDGKRTPDVELDRLASELVRLNITHVCLTTCVKGRSIPSTLSAQIPQSLLNRYASKIKFYSRITILLDDASQNVGISTNPLVQQFDIVALCPCTERALQVACSSLDLDIICLNLAGGRLDYPLRNSIIGEAIQRGIHFEISYSSAIRDSGYRRNLFGNTVSLLRATMTKNIIVSSGATESMDLRGLKDCLHFAFLIGLNGDTPHNALTVNPTKVLERAANRKFTCKSTVSTNHPIKLNSQLHEDFVKLE